MLLPLLLAAQRAAAAPAAADELAPGVTLIRGSADMRRGPDGNTIILDAPAGLIVVDSGRHIAHSDAILRFSAARGRPIAAILNTHWHLDHSSGNGRLKTAFPRAPVYATAAVDGALAPGGFLDRQLAGARELIARQGHAPADAVAGARIFLDTMQTPDTLRPDIVVSRAQRVRIAGRRLDLRVADGAVTAADLWLYDPATQIAVLGDLVTLPAPFFETACPERWRAALDQVWATPFRLAVPGHGEPMTRARFDLYRSAYNAFIDCAHGDAEPAQCAAAWTEAVTPLIAGDDAMQRLAPDMAAYYVAFLRDHAGKSPDCQSA